MNEFLYQASIYLAAAVIAVPLSARLGLGSVLGCKDPGHLPTCPIRIIDVAYFTDTSVLIIYRANHHHLPRSERLISFNHAI